MILQNFDDDFALCMGIDNGTNRLDGFYKWKTAVKDGRDFAVFEEFAELRQIVLINFRHTHVP